METALWVLVVVITIHVLADLMLPSSCQICRWRGFSEGADVDRVAARELLDQALNERDASRLEVARLQKELYATKAIAPLTAKDRPDARP